MGRGCDERNEMKALQILYEKRNRLEREIYNTWDYGCSFDMFQIKQRNQVRKRRPRWMHPLIQSQWHTERMIKALEDGSMTEAEVLVQRLEME